MTGRCFYYETPPNDQHLFVVLAPSLDREDWFLCANITTKRELSDTTCELLAGEHECFTSPVSVVVYGQTRELPRRLIERLWDAQQLPALAPAILARVQRAPLTRLSRLKGAFQTAIRRHLGMA